MTTQPSGNGYTEQHYEFPVNYLSGTTIVTDTPDIVLDGQFLNLRISEILILAGMFWSVHIVYSPPSFQFILPPSFQFTPNSL